MSIQHTTKLRSEELGGEIKAARSMIAECTAACERSAAAHQSDCISLEKAEQRLTELLAERERIADQARAEALSAGEEAGQAPPTFTWLNNLGDAVIASDAHANGLAKVADSELPEF